MSRIAVFGYGSLASPTSAAQTLGRPLEAGPWLATLPGWRRRWSQARDNLASEKTFARREDGSIPAFVLGLNIERSDRRAPPLNGVLIDVSQAELERLDVREIRYERIDVTAEVELEPGPRGHPGQVITYVARASNLAPDPPPGGVVLSAYATAVERAFDELGAGQLERYRETTDPPPVEVIDGVLVRDSIPPGNPRLW